ncbi:uncharacterized protein PgNI_08009 [Pyricularia grisea]|uniref:AMP-dependent synthetase/ligase domain-containing protein n=1 Tax=Pyricularia grisea TaxID=148305 RepID=A0A6P8AWL9_PYRGI|nr:uncharacterized protein PgNI_08009 [Pyricularia grisea]TLD06595.1 hypothetical protein PgNI_08009 [Pyricularia grisea]
MAPLKEVDMLSAYDRQRIEELNANLPQAKPGLFHDLIARHFAERPEHEAICAWDGSFTYSQVDDISSRIAAHLTSLGVGPESLVPFCIEKSAWAIIAMVSIMKAGAAFVPLDPSHPAARRQTIISQAGARVLLPGQIQSRKMQSTPFLLPEALDCQRV